MIGCEIGEREVREDVRGERGDERGCEREREREREREGEREEREGKTRGGGDIGRTLEVGGGEKEEDKRWRKSVKGRLPGRGLVLCFRGQNCGTDARSVLAVLRTAELSRGDIL